MNFCRLPGSTHILIGWITPTPPEVSSLLAPSLRDVTSRIPALPHSALRFSQPLSRTCVLTACGFVPPRWHSQGIDLQSLTSNRSTTVFSCPASTLSPSLHGFLPVIAGSSHCLAAELTSNPTLALTGPVLQAAGFHLEIRSYLEALLPVLSVSYAVRFHSFVAMTTLMTFCPSGYQASPPWMLSFLLQGL